MWLTKNNKNFKRKNILIIIEHKYYTVIAIIFTN